MSDAVRGPGEWAVGDVLSGVRVGQVAHGGHWVARHEGRVVFIRHVLAGELVDVRVTGLAKRFAFGEAVAVHESSEHRVAPPCAIATVCGGCDFQHVTLSHQRELKRQVVAEQLSRLAEVDWEGEVEPLDPPDLGWRSRMRYHRGPAGWGLRARGSHEVLTLPPEGCLIAAPDLAHPDDAGPDVPGDALVGARTADGHVWTEPGSDLVVREEAVGRSWGVRAAGFWQVHPEAADALAATVLEMLAPSAGETALDLYCGVGLFSGALADAGCTVLGIEGDATAVELAGANVPSARFEAGPVDRVLRRERERPDVVVLDPPRTGAGKAVVAEVCRRSPRAIAYVACDPAALARDLATALDHGYLPVDLRVFDLFPQTHHVECVALLERG